MIRVELSRNLQCAISPAFSGGTSTCACNVYQALSQRVSIVYILIVLQRAIQGNITSSSPRIVTSAKHE